MPTIKKVSPSPKKFVFPPKEEFERVVKRIAHSDRRTNIGLVSNTTPTEKAKYKLCKSILGYKQDNNLTTKSVAKQLGLTIAKTEKILYSHIDELNLEELLDYANALHVPCQLRINLPYVQKEIAQKAY
ncbi:MAG: hypothetical protein MRERV_76c001 [Mycoplasmataceae bacterium RV_VA103A]|nr:MAG: hypothetical protein MRERV_76c001 [Mycoplasmataceae bacterium RV_VA103A]